jgi:hypothetical protein
VLPRRREAAGGHVRGVRLIEVLSVRRETHSRYLWNTRRECRAGSKCAVVSADFVFGWLRHGQRQRDADSDVIDIVHSVVPSTPRQITSRECDGEHDSNKDRQSVHLATAEIALGNALLSSDFLRGAAFFNLFEQTFPTLGGLQPKCSILGIDRMP